MYYRALDDSKLKDLYMLQLSHLIQIRNYYFDANKKNIFDNTIFSDFVIDCLGEPISAKKEMSDRIKENKAKGKPPIFAYRPDQGIKSAAHDFQFKNSSGNKINNEKNFKIV